MPETQINALGDLGELGAYHVGYQIKRTTKSVLNERIPTVFLSAFALD